VILASGALLAAVLASAAPAPVAPARDVARTLLLIGDAGDPAPGGEPVLQALSRELAQAPSRTLVVFLGDNVYPAGLAARGAPGREEGERRLDTQVGVVLASGARGIFLPGNHDWSEGGPDGWAAIRREVERVNAHGAPAVSMLPEGGCPGPVVKDVGSWLRLVLLDTQWWLHEFDKPEDPDSGCPQDSETEVLSALHDALRTAGARHVVVAAHHPLATGGPHGGYFTLKQHLFPLTDANRSLFIPLPLIGSLYPLARRAGASLQDLANAQNRQMREGLESVFRDHPPLVYASGHEHALQVLDGSSARHLLVSGAGIYAHESSVKKLPATRFASKKAGFMKLEIQRDGRVRLGVIEVDRRGSAVERYAAWLTDQASASRSGGAALTADPAQAASPRASPPVSGPRQ
jgi:Calcineurin-like phosphoesterase